MEVIPSPFEDGSEIVFSNTRDLRGKEEGSPDTASITTSSSYVAARQIGYLNIMITIHIKQNTTTMF